MTKVKDLNPHRFNPRKMSDNKKESLSLSVDTFGDLGGIVYNIRTNRIVSGHQRVSVMDPEAKAVVTQSFEKATDVGTVSLGYFEHKGERINFREVDWDEKKEAEALLAANKFSGEWDAENLRVLFANTPGIDVGLTGFTVNELEMYDIEIPEIEVPEIEIQEPDFNESDEQYLKNNKGPEEEIRQERIPPKTEYTNTSPPKRDPEPVREVDLSQEAVEIVEEIKEKRHLIVIDAKNAELKAELKDKIKPILEGSEAVMA